VGAAACGQCSAAQGSSLHSFAVTRVAPLARTAVANGRDGGRFGTLRACYELYLELLRHSADAFCAHENDAWRYQRTTAGDGTAAYGTHLRVSRTRQNAGWLAAWAGTGRQGTAAGARLRSRKQGFARQAASGAEHARGAPAHYTLWALQLAAGITSALQAATAPSARCAAHCTALPLYLSLAHLYHYHLSGLLSSLILGGALRGCARATRKRHRILRALLLYAPGVLGRRVAVRKPLLVSGV